MTSKISHKQIKRLFEKSRCLTHVEVSVKIKKDKARVSGYLQAMVYYGELVLRKFGNSKAYFLKEEKK